jgi:ABC-type antimicrobial peptide transport system permease subunit
VFAALALLLGGVGVYGVVSYAVARRRAEFAVRMALGASPAHVLREVLRVGLTPVVAGVVLGIGVALSLAGVAARFLYGVAATDAASISAAALVLLAAGLLSAIGPALRAGHTSPTQALRE